MSAPHVQLHSTLRLPHLPANVSPTWSPSARVTTLRTVLYVRTVHQGIQSTTQATHASSTAPPTAKPVPVIPHARNVSVEPSSMPMEPVSSVRSQVAVSVRPMAAPVSPASKDFTMCQANARYALGTVHSAPAPILVRL
jgi:hypothetical protein